MKRLTAKVPVEYIEQGIKWLAIQQGEDGFSWYLLMFCELGEHSDFDSWYLTKEVALLSAEEQYGIGPDDWTLEDVE